MEEKDKERKGKGKGKSKAKGVSKDLYNDVDDWKAWKKQEGGDPEQKARTECLFWAGDFEQGTAPTTL